MVFRVDNPATVDGAASDVTDIDARGSSRSQTSSALRTKALKVMLGDTS